MNYKQIKAAYAALWLSGLFLLACVLFSCRSVRLNKSVKEATYDSAVVKAIDSTGKKTEKTVQFTTQTKENTRTIKATFEPAGVDNDLVINNRIKYGYDDDTDTSVHNTSDPIKSIKHWNDIFENADVGGDSDLGNPGTDNIVISKKKKPLVIWKGYNLIDSELGYHVLQQSGITIDADGTVHFNRIPLTLEITDSKKQSDSDFLSNEKTDTGAKHSTENTDVKNTNKETTIDKTVKANNFWRFTIPIVSFILLFLLAIWIKKKIQLIKIRKTTL
jgi:hypothetical protein